MAGLAERSALNLALSIARDLKRVIRIPLIRAHLKKAISDGCVELNSIYTVKMSILLCRHKIESPIGTIER